MSASRRTLLLAEAVLLLAPVTLLATLGFAWSARYLALSIRDGQWQDPTSWMTVVIAAGLVGTASGWWLLIRFLRGGPASVARGAGLAWTGAALGLAAAIAGAWLAATGNGWIFAVGLPAVLPMLHLWRLRSDAPRR